MENTEIKNSSIEQKNEIKSTLSLCLGWGSFIFMLTVPLIALILATIGYYSVKNEALDAHQAKILCFISIMITACIILTNTIMSL